MNKYILHIYFFSFLLIFLSKIGNAQVGLNFQGVARKSDNTVIASQLIKVKLSILQGTANGELEYSEVRGAMTNAQGLFTLVIGDTGALNTLGNFNNINWKIAPKFLKIDIDPSGGDNYITMGITQFQYVPYAKYASSVDAENIVGAIPIRSGGTGVQSLIELKTALQLDKVNNTSDIAKPINSLTQAAIDSKLGLAEIINYTKKTYVDSTILTKVNNSDTSLMLSNRIARDTISLSNRINNKLNISDTAGMLNNRIARDTISLSNRINNKLNISDTAGMLSNNYTRINTLGTNILSYTASITSNTNAIIANTASITSILNTPLTYGSITGVIPIWNQSTTGNAATATTAGTASSSTKLTTARNINGIPFDGTGDITVTADAGNLTGTILKSTVTGSSLTSVGTLMSLEVNGRATNTNAYNAATATTIDFTKSNLAYTSNSPGAFTLSGIKDGGTFTLAVQGTTAGTSSFTSAGFTFLSVNNGVTTSGKHTLYTFIVMGTYVYYFMTAGF